MTLAYLVVMVAALNWQVPTQNCDGSTVTDLAGYEIQWGSISRSSVGMATDQPANCSVGAHRSNFSYEFAIDIPDPAARSYDVVPPGPGEWYMTIAAYNAAGEYSVWSREVFKVMFAAAALPVLTGNVCTDCEQVATTLVISDTGQQIEVQFDPGQGQPVLFDQTDIQGSGVIPNESAFNQERATWRASFRLNSLDRNHGLFSKDESGCADAGHITAWITDANVARVRHQPQGCTGAHDLLGSTPVSVGQLHSVEVELSAGGIELRLDGNVEASGSPAWGTHQTSMDVVAGGACTTCSPGTTDAIQDAIDGELQLTILGEAQPADEIQVQVIEYPDGTVPIASGSFQPTTTSWPFTPPRAGLYYTRLRQCTSGVCEAWINSFEQVDPFLYYFELASPGGGGIN